MWKRLLHRHAHTSTLAHFEFWKTHLYTYSKCRATVYGSKIRFTTRYSTKLCYTTIRIMWSRRCWMTLTNIGHSKSLHWTCVVNTIQTENEKATAWCIFVCILCFKKVTRQLQSLVLCLSKTQPPKKPIQVDNLAQWWASFLTGGPQCAPKFTRRAAAGADGASCWRTS